MATVQSESRDTPLDDLELLWATPARRSPTTSPAPPLRERVRDLTPRGRTLGGAWFVAFVVLSAAPVPADEADAPLVWWDALALGVAVLAVVGVGFLAARLAHVPRGWACSAVGAGLGVLLGIECRTSGHHLGYWWVFETAAFAAVAAISLAGAAGRRSR